MGRDYKQCSGEEGGKERTTNKQTNECLLPISAPKTSIFLRENVSVCRTAYLQDQDWFSADFFLNCWPLIPGWFELTDQWVNIFLFNLRWSSSCWNDLVAPVNYSDDFNPRACPDNALERFHRVQGSFLVLPESPGLLIYKPLQPW